jgi:phage I-like protein
VQLTIGADADPLPTEFRLFACGANETSKGTFVFDDMAAQAVMAAYQREGVDLMVDLGHDSLNEAARIARSDATDAMGWFQLALRDGELWACDVRWTPEGERRLRAKTQRYISPAFDTVEAKNESGAEVVSYVLNVALVSMPATYGAQPLVAASRYSTRRAPHTLSEGSMDPKVIREVIRKALDAIEAGDESAALQILKELIASAAGAAPEPEEPPAAEASPDMPPEEQTALAALAREACTLTGHSSAGEALEALRALYAERAQRAQTDAAEAAARELSSRRELVGELVKLTVEYPSTAWADAEKRIPCKRLSDEPIADLRARVATLRALRKGQPASKAEPPVRLGSDFTDHERALVKGMNDDQRARYLELRASRRAS